MEFLTLRCGVPWSGHGRLSLTRKERRGHHGTGPGGDIRLRAGPSLIHHLTTTHHHNHPQLLGSLDVRQLSISITSQIAVLTEGTNKVPEDLFLQVLAHHKYSISTVSFA